MRTTDAERDVRVHRRLIRPKGATALIGVTLGLGLGLAGCSSTGAKAGSASVPASGAASTGAAPATSAAAGSSTGATGATGATGGASPAGALSRWLTDVVGQQYQDACRVMVSTGSLPASASAAVSAVSSPSAAAGTPVRPNCSDIAKPIFDGQSIQSTLARLTTIFTPTATAGAGKAVAVHVAPVTAQDGSATVNARSVTVDGQRLDEIVVAHSTGVTDDQLQLTFPMYRVDGSWYVGDFNLQIG